MAASIATRNLRTNVRDFQAPLRIGVVADTHLRRGSPRLLPDEVANLFERYQVGLILHAGDANDESAFAPFASVAPLIAVAGNNDSVDLQEQLSEREKIAVSGHTIGLVHGHGGRTARLHARCVFTPSPDLVVYGHSHIPVIEEEHGVIYFNPGSPTDRRLSPHFGVGILHVTEDRIEPELVLFRRSAELDRIDPPSHIDTLSRSAHE